MIFLIGAQDIYPWSVIATPVVEYAGVTRSVYNLFFSQIGPYEAVIHVNV
jgi:hypothetical protein